LPGPLKALDHIMAQFAKARYATLFSSLAVIWREVVKIITNKFNKVLDNHDKSREYEW
jgi:hypothetical protein